MGQKEIAARRPSGEIAREHMSTGGTFDLFRPERAARAPWAVTLVQSPQVLYALSIGQGPNPL